MLICQDEPVLNQAKKICSVIRECRGREFSPGAVDAFLRMSRLEFLWLDVLHNPSFVLFFTGDIRPVSLEQTVELTQLVSRIIDFRSPFSLM